MQRTRLLIITVAAATTTVGALSACASSAENAAVPTSGKTWAVDSSGWWVPGDPTGCLAETTTCKMNAWPTRAYVKGGSIPNLLVHGTQVELLCAAPTPASIRSAIKTESVNWFLTKYDGKTYWLPDIYATKTDVNGMAQNVPVCPSTTPGING